MGYLEAVLRERERQKSQGKSENLTNMTWYLVVTDQLAMITRTLSLSRYRGVSTIDGEAEVEAGPIKMGLVRLGACAMAWYEHLE